MSVILNLFSIYTYMFHVCLLISNRYSRSIVGRFFTCLPTTLLQAEDQLRFFQNLLFISYNIYRDFIDIVFLIMLLEHL